MQNDDVIEFHGYCECDCCLDKRAYCHNVKSPYKIDTICNVCDECSNKITKAGKLDNYNPKTDAQKDLAKAEQLLIRSRSRSRKDSLFKVIINHFKK